MKGDKRASQRRNLRIPISCWEIDGGRPVGPGVDRVCHDLSAVGLSFETPTLYRIDSSLLAEVHLPGRKAPLVVRLRVSRVESVIGKERYRIGTRFVDLSDDDRHEIVSCLEKVNIYSVLRHALTLGASDVHLTVGRPPVIRVQGRLFPLKLDPIEEGHIRAMLFPLLSDAQIVYVEEHKELDFAFSPSVDSRFRVNLHYQRGFLEAVMRSVPTHTKSFQELGLPATSIQRLCRERAGLILIAGTTGAGKTTTLSSMVDFINRNLECVVITIEDPIEFTHTSQRSVIKQRELGSDTATYSEALRRSLRQDPDVIVVGELSDNTSVQSALRAAETGHLVISTIHAPDTEQAVERIITLFPPEHAASVCQQLASSLVAILFQALIPGKAASRVLVSELMIANHAIRNLIRERRLTQIPNCIQTGRNTGMYTLQSCLDELRRKGAIDDEVMQEFARTK